MDFSFAAKEITLTTREIVAIVGILLMSSYPAYIATKGIIEIPRRAKEWKEIKRMQNNFANINKKHNKG